MVQNGTNNKYIKLRMQSSREENIQRLAELEEQYKVAKANSENERLVAEYEHWIAVKADYAANRKLLETEMGIDVDKAIEAAARIVSEIRVNNVGVDARDLEAIKTELNILKRVVEGEKTQDNGQDGMAM